jgi:hypothetical protein
MLVSVINEIDYNWSSITKVKAIEIEMFSNF